MDDAVTAGPGRGIELAGPVAAVIEQLPKESRIAIEFRCIRQIQAPGLLFQTYNTDRDVPVVAAVEMTACKHSVDGLDHVEFLVERNIAAELIPPINNVTHLGGRVADTLGID